MIVSRRIVVLASTLTLVVGYAVGLFQSHRADASVKAAYDSARTDHERSQAALVSAVKQELTSEMGLVPVSLMRDRRSSFVELYSTDRAGKTHYGTAGYLGHGHFITVKHAVVALRDETLHTLPAITSVKIVYHGEEIPAQVVDAGAAETEVDSGDWAIIQSRDVDLPALSVDTSFAFDFAEPIFRLGNDYSRGIILSAGYAGQRTPEGLITCLIDGHPGVSGGGVLDRHGNLVGIPIGRMEGDYRFSFILPLRPEMLRKVKAHSARPPSAEEASVRREDPVLPALVDVHRNPQE
jgi:hypothetical protein